MIDFPIVDTHLHVWDPGLLPYPWLASAPTLNKQFLLADYDQACRPYTVEKMVFVQCEVDFGRYRDEVDWVSRLAERDGRIAGIVAWVPLEKGLAAEAEVGALAANKLLKGIRRIIQFEPDDGFCLRPDFVKGVRLLAKYGLTFDICVKGAAQTENVINLVRQCPEVTFILDHIGKPMIARREMEPWKSHIQTLASMPNVFCKISGLVVEADCKNWTVDDLRPYLDHVLERFGVNRVMFGGDWPVVLNAATLRRWIDVLDQATLTLSPLERKRLFHDNGSAFYRL